MNLALIVPLADTWGMHGDVGTGWWIAMGRGDALLERPGIRNHRAREQVMKDRSRAAAEIGRLHP